jgi:hypothetical protein
MMDPTPPGPTIASPSTSDDFVNQLDLSRLANRLVSEDGLKDIDFAHEAILEYKRFFFILTESGEFPCRRFLPSSIVDLVWQRHMLDTLNYFDDCNRFDMPGGYCHRHELYSTGTDVVDGITCLESAKAVCPSVLDNAVQAHYTFTLKEYESMYGCRPREDVWPRVYNCVAQHEKRKMKITATAAEMRCLSYAVPHAGVPYLNPATMEDIDTYVLPDELVIMKNTMWVGEMVYKTLPLKQLKCVKGEVISQISFEPQGQDAVTNVVREYARFLLLVMRRARDDMIASRQGRMLREQPEITPSKLVDELWHAHILCSPAYFQFW